MIGGCSFENGESVISGYRLLGVCVVSCRPRKQYTCGTGFESSGTGSVEMQLNGKARESAKAGPA